MLLKLKEVFSILTSLTPVAAEFIRAGTNGETQAVGTAAIVLARVRRTLVTICKQGKERDKQMYEQCSVKCCVWMCFRHIHHLVMRSHRGGVWQALGIG